jgi:cation diffusion facilitator family transporter
MNKRSRNARQVTILGAFINLLLFCGKFFAGIFGHSTVMIADAIHTISDLISDWAVLLGFKMAERPEDSTHDYGHARFETLSTVVISTMLLFAGLYILTSGLKEIYIHYICKQKELADPNFIALTAAFISILTKEFLYQYTTKVGKAIHSDALLANALHHRTDALSSIAALFGIGGAIFLGNNWRILDPLAALLISIFIIKVALDLLFKNLNQLLDCALSKKDKNTILKIVAGTKGVKDLHKLKTRMLGNNVAIDIHIQVARHITIVAAHNIASLAEQRLKKHFGQQTYISIHIEPAKK